jgi:hypothetical protein
MQVQLRISLFPEHIQNLRRHHEPIDAHPQTDHERRNCQGHDKVREYGRDEDHRLCGEKIEEEPHDPSHECDKRRLEVREPVRYDGKNKGDYSYCG